MFNWIKMIALKVGDIIAWTDVTGWIKKEKEVETRH